ncbi:FkbM family methyltransferase [Azospirillum lipoferum]|uniref:FkbM family methyltransferase n=1 Tax=Azospirillum lipoferum TaxID=193 RepID=A0A5A9GDD7_AZOLI|nr:MULTISPECIES: FkbM family methyltransferase [Azospirillum]KAA0592401.1 FkbM family methyltransferase [Azospirillum lipoferum]MCP1614562.1 FkbM family methyltransferase [Azospirillum lipoferum]MDW5532607.1 FkbM family methyltransferase [Azospirillum sp. NL1]
MLPNATVVETKMGRFLLFDTDDGITRFLRRDGQWEPVTLMFAKALVGIWESNTKKAGGTIVDGGANVGAFTIPMALTFQNSHRVVSFEVQRPLYHLICGSLALNGLDCVLVHNLALGERMDVIEIPIPDYASDCNLGALSLDPEVRRVRRESGIVWDTDRPEARMGQASMVRLDDFGIDDLCLLKLDVEGMELPVLKGAAETLTRSGYPPVLFELWDVSYLPGIRDAQEALLSHLDGLGYEVLILGETAIAQHRSHGIYLRARQEDDGRRLTFERAQR